MTILLAALLFQVVPTLQELHGSDVVVSARKLERLDILLKRRRGRLVCLYKRSSGDSALDAAACSIGIACHEKATNATELKSCITAGLTALVTPSVDPA